MRYKAGDPKFKNCKVELDGVFQEHVVEADDEEGWVRIEYIKYRSFGRAVYERKTLYGRVFIVKIITDDEEQQE